MNAAGILLLSDQLARWILCNITLAVVFLLLDELDTAVTEGGLELTT